ncbi:MAG: winged helix-turn-helix domain-containing protein [Myxococcota bacterium]
MCVRGIEPLACGLSQVCRSRHCDTFWVMAGTLILNDATVDLNRREVRRGADTIELTELEAELLAWLAARPGEPAGRDRLLVEVWGFPRPVRTRAVDNTVSRLRQKIEANPAAPEYLRTIRGRGYVLELPEAAVPNAEAPRPSIRTALLAPPSSFHGRRDALARLDQLFDGGARLITVTGPGGAGKTRLITRWLARRDAMPPTRAVDLSTARDRTDLLKGVADALGIALAGSARDISVIGRALGGLGRALLVLDNLEQLQTHLAETAGVWLRQAPRLTILATSRVRLRLQGEERIALGGLRPEDAHTLFLRRVQAIAPDTTLDTSDGGPLRDALDRLDRHPLSIELLAARCGAMGIRTALARLDDTLRLLAGGPIDAPTRQRSLYATLQWSWSLLDDPQQAALAACGVFDGPFDADEAEVALDFGADAPWPADLLAALIDASLIARDGPRFRLLLAVQAFARRQLAARADRSDIEDRVAAYLVARGRSWLARLNGPEHRRWQRRITQARPTLLWLAEVIGDRAPGIAAHLMLISTARQSAKNVDSLDLAEQMVARAEASGAADLRAQARAELSKWHAARGNLSAAIATITPALDLARTHGVWPQVLSLAARFQIDAGNRARAAHLLEDAIRVSEAHHHSRGLAFAFTHRGNLHFILQQESQAVADWRAALREHEAHGRTVNTVHARRNIAMVLQRRPETEDEAHALITANIAQSRTLAMNGALAGNLLQLAWLCLLRADMDAARDHLHEARPLVHLQGNQAQRAEWELVAGWHALFTDPEQARNHFSASLDIERRRGAEMRTLPLLYYLAVTFALEDQLSQAEDHMARARQGITHHPVLDLAQEADLLEITLDLARARRADNPTPHLQRARDRWKRNAPYALSSTRIRMGRRLLVPLLPD